jgi:hypothetical protein
MPCNFEINLITRLGVIVLFSSFFSSPGPKGEVLPSLGVRKELILVAMFVGRMEPNEEAL